MYGAGGHAFMREVQLHILHRNVRASRNGNKHAMVSTRRNVLVVPASAVVAAAVAAGDAFAAAAVASLGAAKPTAVDDDDVDNLCRRVCRERCHGLHGPVEPRRRAPGRRLAA